MNEPSGWSEIGWGWDTCAIRSFLKPWGETGFAGEGGTIEPRAPGEPKRFRNRERKIPLNMTCKFCFVFSLFLSLLLLAGCGGGGGKKVIRVGHGLPEDHPIHQALLEVQAHLRENGVETLEVRIFPNNQLGSSVDHVQMISAGQIDAGVISAAGMARMVPELNVLNLPFLFRDTDHMREVVRSEKGKELLAYLEPRNMFGYGFFTAGSRNIMAKRPVLRPEDLSGLNIRVMESNMLVSTIRAMGGSPVSMDMAEVYGALQQGVIDGWENNPPTAYFFRMNETGANHFSWTNHLIIPDVVVASAALRQRLTEDEFGALEAAFLHAIEKQWENWEVFTAESIRQLQEAGMVFHEVNEEAFRARVEGIYTSSYERYGADFRRLTEAIRNYGLNANPSGETDR
jgi:tripartite ATP-independent transporter DctP family solute receptor